MKRLRVAVLFGGASAEHEVSCMSAQHVIAAMDPNKYEVVPIGITRGGRFTLPDASRKVLEGGDLEETLTPPRAEGEVLVISADPRSQLAAADSSSPVGAFSVDVVFPVLHGPNGEDGTVQGLLELADLPYVGSGVLGSAVGMDKEKMKLLFAGEGLPTPEFAVVRDYEWKTAAVSVLDQVAAFGFPCFTKPANMGSSVGITKCRDRDSLAAGIDAAFEFDRKVLIEEGIDGREIECGVLGDDHPEASVCGEVLSGREFYDYEAKYFDESSRTVIPADVPGPVADLVRAYAVRAFKAIDAAGFARVDFFYQESGRAVLVNEINTIPGFTTISMFPKLWEATGLSYPALIDRIIELGLQRHRSKRRPA